MHMPPPLSPLAFIWTHEPHRFLIQFSENFGIRWYGLAYVLGFVGGAWLLFRYARANPPRSLLPAEKIWDLIIALVLGVVIGGRLGYFILYTPEALWNNPLELFRVWDGGMASHGGFAGVIIALAWFAWRNKIPFLHISDLAASITSLGLMLGRVANFLNGELWGTHTDGTWGVIFSQTDPDRNPLPRHPSQLYEAALEGALLLAYAQWRVWRTDAIRAHPGRLAGEYFVLYATFRAICEHFREPDATLILGLSRGTFYSIFLFITGIALIIYSIIRNFRTTKTPTPTHP